MSPPSENLPQASRWDWVQAGLLALNLAATTCALGGYLRSTFLWSVGVTLLTVGVKLSRGAWAGADARPRWHAAGWWLVPFLVCGAINAWFVSPVGWLAWRDWLGWAQLALTFWLALDVVGLPGPRRLLRATVLGLGVLLVALGCYQRFVDPQWMMLGRTQTPVFFGRASGTFGIPNSMAVFLVMLLPVVLAGAWDRRAGRTARVWAGVASAWFAVGLVLTVSRGPWLALGLALAAWPLWNTGWSWRRRLGWAAGAGALAVAAGAILYVALPGVRERLDQLARNGGEKTRPILWSAAQKLWREAPGLGTGAGSYNVLFERHRPERFWDEPQWAHNDYLNTLSDYGLVGAGLGLGGIAALAWTAGRRRRDGRSGAPVAGFGVALGAFGLALSVDFHLKLPALAMLVALVAAEWVDAGWPLVSTGPSLPTAWRRALAAIAALAIVVTAVGLIGPQARSEGWREAARRKIDRLARQPLPLAAELSVLAEVRVVLRRAVESDPGNAQAWSDLAYATVLTGRLTPSRAAVLAVEAEAAARKALAGSAVVPEFWWRMGVALDMQGRWNEGSEAFARSVGLAPNLPQAWFYTAYHFSLRPSARSSALSAVATCLRLDPWFPGAEALREQLKARH